MIEQYSMKILGTAAVIYAFSFMLGRLFPKEKRQRNYFRLALYVFWFGFLWLSANFAVKCLCYFFVRQGDDIYASLSANRIFTEGILVYMGSLAAAAGSSKENRRYGRRQKQVLALIFLIGCLAVWAAVSIQSVMEKNAVWAFGLLLFMIIYLILLCLTENCFCIQNEEYERAKFEAGVEKQVIYYQELEKNQQEVYKLYHDMKNHFMMLENIQKKDEIRDYINGCMGRVRRIEGIVHTGNVYADTMIYDKWSLAEELGIKFMLAVEDNVFVGIEIFDLTVLIGNILDNAVEAVQREETGDRKIFFKVWRRGKLSLMMTENTCTREPKQEDGELATVKSDEKYHGFGVKNVKEMVKKYKGTVRTEYKDGKFRVLVMVMGE